MKTNSKEKKSKKISTGKAFEYAVIKTVFEELLNVGWDRHQIKIVDDTPTFKQIKKKYQEAVRDEEEKSIISTGSNSYDVAARPGVSYIILLEPMLNKLNDAYITIGVILLIYNIFKEDFYEKRNNKRRR